MSLHQHSAGRGGGWRMSYPAYSRWQRTRLGDMAAAVECHSDVTIDLLPGDVTHLFVERDCRVSPVPCIHATAKRKSHAQSPLNPSLSHPALFGPSTSTHRLLFRHATAAIRRTCSRYVPRRWCSQTVRMRLSGVGGGTAEEYAYALPRVIAAY